MIAVKDHIAAIEASIPDLGSSEGPTLLGELERLKGLIWARLISRPSHAVVPNKGTDLLTMPQVAKRLSIPEGRAYELARQGQLPVVRVGKYVRVDPTQLAQWIGEHAENGLDKSLSFKNNLGCGNDRGRAAKASKALRSDAEGHGRVGRTLLEQRGENGAE
jgi:excisionase family DNA binding protein